ncbi:hypothetical protein JCM3766R1_003491 [Sporobolomyces carnicolor]
MVPYMGDQEPDKPVAPIAIASPTSPFSSSAHSFNLRSPPGRNPSSFSPASDDPTVLLDGPLCDLVPATTVGSPTSESSLECPRSLALGVGGRGGWGVEGRLGSSPPPVTKTGPTPRRIVSAPLGLWTHPNSPPRASPLSRSVSSMLDEEDDLLLPQRDPSSPPSLYRPVPTPVPSTHRRRRSSASLHNPPFGSLVGSFENSILSGRMSALPSRPLQFTCSIGVLGSRDAPKRLQCPSHLHVEFGAVFYSSPEDSRTSPYVGTVDLERHFVSLLSSSTSHRPPKFPGYQVPCRGQVQIVLKNSNQTAFKPFLVPYDLGGLNRNGQGGRTFLRQKSYLVEREAENAKGTIRFAIHLTFCSPPLKKGVAGGGAAGKEPKYYLYQNIRLVFAPQAFDPREKVRVVLEGPAEFLYGPSSSSSGSLEGSDGRDDKQERQKWREGQFGDYRGPGEEWETAREEFKQRVREQEQPRLDGGGVIASDTTGCEPSQYTPELDLSRHEATPSFDFVDTFLPAASPQQVVHSSSARARLPISRHPLSVSTTFSSPVSPVFPALHPAPSPLTFDRTTRKLLLTIPPIPAYESLVEIALARFKLSGRAELVYKDEDGDVITLSCDEELQDLFMAADRAATSVRFELRQLEPSTPRVARSDDRISEAPVSAVASSALEPESPLPARQHRRGEDQDRLAVAQHAEATPTSEIAPSGREVTAAPTTPTLLFEDPDETPLPSTSEIARDQAAKEFPPPSTASSTFSSHPGAFPDDPLDLPLPSSSRDDTLPFSNLPTQLTSFLASLGTRSSVFSSTLASALSPTSPHSPTSRLSSILSASSLDDIPVVASSLVQMGSEFAEIAKDVAIGVRREADEIRAEFTRLRDEVERERTRFREEVRDAVNQASTPRSRDRAEERQQDTAETAGTVPQSWTPPCGTRSDAEGSVQSGAPLSDEDAHRVSPSSRTDSGPTVSDETTRLLHKQAKQARKEYRAAVRHAREEKKRARSTRSASETGEAHDRLPRSEGFAPSDCALPGGLPSTSSSVAAEL